MLPCELVFGNGSVGAEAKQEPSHGPQTLSSVWNRMRGRGHEERHVRVVVLTFLRLECGGEW